MRNWLLQTLPDSEIFGANKDDIALLIILLLTLALTIFATKIFRLLLIALSRKIKLHKYEHQAEICKRHNVLKKASAIISPVFLLLLLPSIFPPEDFGDAFFNITTKLLLIYLYTTIWFFLIATLSAIDEIVFSQKGKSVRGFIQIIQLAISIVIFILAVSMLLEKSPFNILAGLGASTAVVMFIFKDTLLGFVASVQLTVNDMLQAGDWITMEKYGADGIVIEIGLTAVKVKNWDNTITNIPIYSLVSDSYQNWRGMTLSGGRRVMRSIPIDMQSIKFCTDEMLKNYSKISILKEYIVRKQRELYERNKASNLDLSVPLNEIRLTNLGIFREYIERWLENNPNVNLAMTHFVRQLQPTERGLPLQIYFFTTIDWIDYEDIQSEVFEHIIASVPTFELRIFQEETDKE